MDNEKQAANRTVTRRWRRWVMCLGVVVLASLLYGVWRYYHVADFTPIDHTPLPRWVDGRGGQLFDVSRDSILGMMRQYPDPCLFFMDALQPMTSGGYSVCGCGHEVVRPLVWHCTPDWQRFAILDTGKLEFWQGGQRRWVMKMPIQCTDIFILGSGLVYGWSWESRRLWVLDGKRIITRGTMPFYSPSHTYSRPFFSPDGNIMLIDNEQEHYSCYRVEVTGEHMTFIKCFDIDESPSSPLSPVYPTFVGNGHILFNNGALYGMHGRMHQADGWQLQRVSAVITAGVESGPLIVQEHPGASGREYRCLNVQTGDYWMVPPAPNHSGFLSTSDGRYAAYVQRLFPSTFQLLLYEKPGRLRARLRLVRDKSILYYIDPDTQARYRLESARLSPDGHTLYITTTQGYVAKQKRELWRFRW